VPHGRAEFVRYLSEQYPEDAKALDKMLDLMAVTNPNQSVEHRSWRPLKTRCERENQPGTPKHFGAGHREQGFTRYRLAQRRGAAWGLALSIISAVQLHKE